MFIWEYCVNTTLIYYIIFEINRRVIHYVYVSGHDSGISQLIFICYCVTVCYRNDNTDGWKTVSAAAPFGAVNTLRLHYIILLFVCLWYYNAITVSYYYQQLLVIPWKRTEHEFRIIISRLFYTRCIGYYPVVGTINYRDRSHPEISSRIEQAMHWKNGY